MPVLSSYRSHEAWKLWRMLLPCSLQKRVRKAPPPPFSHTFWRLQRPHDSKALLYNFQRKFHTHHILMRPLKLLKIMWEVPAAFGCCRATPEGGVLPCSLQTLWRSHKKVLLFCGLWNFPKNHARSYCVIFRVSGGHVRAKFSGTTSTGFGSFMRVHTFSCSPLDTWPKMILHVTFGSPSLTLNQGYKWLDIQTTK